MSAAERTGAAGGPSARNAWLALALIVAGALWLYRGVLGSGFFADDYLFLDQVRGHSLLEALRLQDPLSNFYRPVSRQFYFWVVAGLTHESPGVFHGVSLGMFAGVLVLLWAVVGEVAGRRAGLVAAGLVALHVAADVPVRWACGSQELLAVGGGLGAVLLHLRGQRVWAGVVLLLGVLSKEVVLLAPVIAVVAQHRRGERWGASVRRGVWLGVALAVWGLTWLAMPHARVEQGAEIEVDLVRSPLGALVDLPRAVLGLEWRRGEFGHLPRVLPPLVPLGLVLAGLWVGWGWTGRKERGAGRGAAGTEARAQSGVGSRAGLRAEVVGVVWALAGTAPVVAVAVLWSAHYYLFAMCGVALALGAWLARQPVGWTLAVVGLIAWGSASARGVEEFALARSPWTPQSHINRYYIERSGRIADAYVGSLLRACPTLPPRSTLFFAGLEGNIAFQSGDGPLIRWAYRDSRMRSYYLTSFTREKARRGPLYFFVASGDTLRELERGPDLLLDVAFSMIISDQPEGARDALELHAERDTASHRAEYWLTWARWACGDTLAALESLRRAGIEPSSRTATERPRALAAVSAGDTLGALWIMQSAVWAAPLDAAAHGLLADLLLVRQHEDPEGAVEAFAARLLAPGDPTMWKRWGMVQLDRGRYLEALRSLERCQALGDPQAAKDSEVQGWVEGLRGRVQGARLAVGDSGPSGDPHPRQGAAPGGVDRIKTETRSPPSRNVSPRRSCTSAASCTTSSATSCGRWCSARACAPTAAA